MDDLSCMLTDMDQGYNLLKILFDLIRCNALQRLRYGTQNINWSIVSQFKGTFHFRNKVYYGHSS